MNDSALQSSRQRIALGITGAASLIFALLWLNNLVAAWQYHAALLCGSHTAAQNAATGLFAVLKWSTADVSTVSTLIPFFGFLLMFAGVRRIRFSDDWPFFPSYDRLNIALGLIGTLWGIILIGYYPANEVSVEALMSCLHTAMFSTLVAVIWVMVLEPLVFRPWLNAVRASTGTIPDEDISLTEWLDSWAGGMAKADRAIQDMASSSAAFHQELAGLNSVLNENRIAEKERAERISAVLGSMQTLLTGFKEMENALTAERRELLDEKAELGTKLAAALEELTQAQTEEKRLQDRAEKLQNDAAAATREKEETAAENVQLTRSNQELTEKIASLEAETAKLTRQLAAIREALTRP